MRNSIFPRPPSSHRRHPPIPPATSAVSKAAALAAPRQPWFLRHQLRGNNSLLSNIIGKFFGTQDVVPPPPTVSSGSASGNGRNAAGGSLGSNVIPPPPSKSGEFDRSLRLSARFGLCKKPGRVPRRDECNPSAAIGYRLRPRLAIRLGKFRRIWQRHAPSRKYCSATSVGRLRFRPLGLRTTRLRPRRSRRCRLGSRSSKGAGGNSAKSGIRSANPARKFGTGRRRQGLARHAPLAETRRASVVPAGHKHRSRRRCRQRLDRRRLGSGKTGAVRAPIPMRAAEFLPRPVPAALATPPPARPRCPASTFAAAAPQPSSTCPASDRKAAASPVVLAAPRLRSRRALPSPSWLHHAPAERLIFMAS